MWGVLMGDVNGQGMYDVEWDEYDGDGWSYTPPRKKEFTWRTKDGRELKLTEMTDEHVRNAIRYTHRQNNHRWNGVCTILEIELKRRWDNQFFDQTKKCPFCGKEMEMGTVETNLEVGWDIPKYQFRCKCGASSNYIKRPNFKQVELD